MPWSWSSSGHDAGGEPLDADADGGGLDPAAGHWLGFHSQMLSHRFFGVVSWRGHMSWWALNLKFLPSCFLTMHPASGHQAYTTERVSLAFFNDDGSASSLPPLPMLLERHSQHESEHRPSRTNHSHPGCLSHFFLVSAHLPSWPVVHCLPGGACDGGGGGGSKGDGGGGEGKGGGGGGKGAGDGDGGGGDGDGGGGGKGDGGGGEGEGGGGEGGVEGGSWVTDTVTCGK